MKGFKALLGLNFKSLMISTMNIGRGKKKAASGIGAMLLLSALMIFISGMFSFMLAESFNVLGGLDIMLTLIVMVAVVFPTVLTIFAGQAVVFSVKDIDLVLSLPLSSFAVMMARVMALYLEALLLVEMLLLPSGVAFLVYGGASGIQGVFFMLRLALSGVFIATIPTILSVTLGGLLTLLLSRIRFKNLFTILFSVVGLVGFMWLYISGLSAFTNANAMLLFNLNQLRAAIANALPPLSWAVQGILGNIPMLLLFAALCLALFLSVTWVFSLFYKRALTSLASHSMKSHYKLTSLKSSGAFSALLKKEMRRFFSTPALVLNSGVGVILILVMAIAALINKNSILSMLGDIQGLGGEGVVRLYLVPILLAVICFCLSTIGTAASSISLEGNRLWILKESPVATEQIFISKAGLNFLLGAIACIVSTPMLGIALNLSVLEIVSVLVLSLLFSLFSSCTGLLMNLIFPRMDSDNVMMVVKNSSSVIFTMLANFAILALCFGLFMLMNYLGLGFYLFAVAAAILLILITAIVIVLLNTVGRKRFALL